MAEKKRKDTIVAAQPAKDSKKSAKPASEAVSAPTPVVSEIPSESAATAVKLAKKPRKRAADFLDDESEATHPKKGKKDAKPSKELQNSLTADGSNGVVNRASDEANTITTTKKLKKKSMIPEATDIQDAELAEDFGQVSDKDQDGEEIDAAPALLEGFDSDNDDPAEDKNYDSSKPVAPIPQFKKTSKKLLQAAESSKGEGPGAVYIGRIPHGFYESQMKEYFSQFGNIKRLRLSRNKKTGASKHFAFIEFEHDSVAKIVAETMDNYLMFGHILKCKYAPAGSLHEDVWKGAGRRYRRVPTHKLIKEQEAKPKTEEQIEKKMRKEQTKRNKKAKLMESIGYDFEMPKLLKPSEVNAETMEEVKAIDDNVEGAILPPPNVPKDEVAITVEEKLKKGKKGKKANTAPPPVAVPRQAEEPKKEVKQDKTNEKSPTPSKVVLQEPQPKAKNEKAKVAKALNGIGKQDKKQLKGILKKPKKIA